MRRRVEVTSCDGPACSGSAEGDATSWLHVASAGVALDFCGWDCLVNHAIAAPDLARASGEPV